MAFQICKQAVFPLNNTYSGPTAVVQFTFNFVFLPGLSACDQLDIAVRAAMFSAGVVPFVKANYLRYVLEEDTSPFIDQYRVTIHLAGETNEIEGTIQGPFRQTEPAVVFTASVLLAIIVGLGLVLLIFGSIGYRIFRGGIAGGEGNGGDGGLFPGVKLSGPTLALAGAGVVIAALFIFSGSGSRGN